MAVLVEAVVPAVVVAESVIADDESAVAVEHVW